MKKRAILFLISFSLIAALVYISEPAEIISTLSQAKLGYIGLALLFWFLGSLIRMGRWDYLLRKTGLEVKFPALLKYYITGMAVSNLSPAKTGDPVRAVFLKKLESKSFSKSLGSVLVERIFDIVTLALISLVSIWMLAYSSSLVNWLYLALTTYAALIFLGIYLVFSKEKFDWFLHGFISLFSFIPKIKGLEDRVEEFSGKLRESLRRYRSPWVVFSSLLFSLIVWVVNGLLVKSVFLSLGFSVPLTVVLAVYSTAVLIGILTLLPGALGSSEMIQVSLFSVFVALSTSTLTSAVLLTRLANYFMYVVIGAILLSTMPEDLVDL